MPWFSSTFTLVNLIRPWCCSASSSRIGSITRHGVHHGAQKSTMTGCSAPSTSLVNVPSLTSMIASLTGTPRTNGGSDLGATQGISEGLRTPLCALDQPAAQCPHPEQRHLAHRPEHDLAPHL